MRYDQTERPAELGFILTDLLLNFNHVLVGATSDGDLSLMILGLQALCSAFTDNDKMFKEEWAAIQKERDELHTKPGMEGYRTGLDGYETEDLEFRIKEYGALVRSAYRMRVISRGETNKVPWNPEGAKDK